MRSHTIEIDDDVFQYLKKRAEPFEDTPNSVLRRELLKNGRTPVVPATAKAVNTMAEPFPIGTPAALQQILEVVRLIKMENHSRNEATRLIARKHSVAQQTVQDKYGRQLGMTADEFDRPLTTSKNDELLTVLVKKFPSYGAVIRKTVNG